MNTNQRNDESTNGGAKNNATAKTSTLAIRADQYLELGEWLDVELKVLEEKYSDFETQHSNRDYFSRS